MTSIPIRSFLLVCDFDQMSALTMCGHLLLVRTRTCTPHTYTYAAQYTCRNKHNILAYTGECWSLSYLCTCLLSVSCCGQMQGERTSIPTENEEGGTIYSSVSLRG